MSLHMMSNYRCALVCGLDDACTNARLWAVGNMSQHQHPGKGIDWASIGSGSHGRGIGYLMLNAMKSLFLDDFGQVDKVQRQIRQTNNAELTTHELLLAVIAGIPLLRGHWSCSTRCGRERDGAIRVKAYWYIIVE
jgi:hypothetical protein